MRKEDLQRFNKLLDLLQGKKEQGEYEYMTLCPAHGDARLSLWVKLQANGKIHLKCHAGCSPFDICEKLGFKITFLYPTPQIVDCYDYVTAEGELLYQEVKFDTTSLERFKVRRQDKKKPGQWIWNKDGVALILYNLFEVLQAEKEQIIFMCEGSKDARSILNKGLVSTAALFNDWPKTDTSPLDNRPVVIMVDNDEAGETKALIAAHDRHGKSSSVKLLRLPDLEKAGDVTDWFEKSEKNTAEKLLALATDKNLKEWYPKESVRERVENCEDTGLAFEHYDPRPIFIDWLEIFHPPEEGPLHYYDEEWLKGCPKTLIYVPISKNSILEQLTQLLLYCYNRSSKNSDDPFKPTPKLVDMILKSGELNRDLDVLKNPTVPIFRPFFMAEKEKNYKTEDIIILKSANFYIPERCTFPRNMDACIALSALPFDYDENTSCPEIEKAFESQWTKDKESVDLLLQFMYYSMKHTHIYKAILCMVGESDSGKTQILELIRNFIGYDSCEALSLSKIGRPFELWRARNAQLLISDDLVVTPHDLLDGSLVENLKSIPTGAPIRLEKKGGRLYSKTLPCQIIMAGNEPPKIPQLSNALSNRFYFLNFPHIYIRGKDMQPQIIEIWTAELAGLLNKVLDSGPDLENNGGFIEPTSSIAVRSRFEGGANPVKRFINEWFDVNAMADSIKWAVRINDMKLYYKQWSEQEGHTQIQLGNFNDALESIPEITRIMSNIKIIDKKGAESWKAVRIWSGLRRKGTDGILENKDAQPSAEEF